MLNRQVKASAISNLTDARYFAAWHVDWLGFKFEEQESDAISPHEVMAIQEWIEGPKIVGEFQDLSAAEILDLAKHCDLDVLEVPCDHPELEALKDKRIGLTVNSDDANLLDQLESIRKMDLSIEYILFYGKNPQNPVFEDASTLVDYATTTPEMANSIEIG